jgi:hypothetical protein
MPKLIVVFETRSSTDIHNFLNGVQGKQELPMGIKVVANTAFSMEFPKYALFFAMLLVALEEGRYSYQVFEAANPSCWEFPKVENPL